MKNRALFILLFKNTFKVNPNNNNLICVDLMHFTKFVLYLKCSLFISRIQFLECI